MADKTGNISEEVSSSHRRTGRREGPQARVPSSEQVTVPVNNMDASQLGENEQGDEVMFKAQLLSAVQTFQQLVQDPRFAKLMQDPPVREQVEHHPHDSQPPKAQLSPKDKGKQVAGISQLLTNPVQMNQRPPTPQPAYFGEGSVFQTMAGFPPGQQYRPGNVFGNMQMGMQNPLYANIGMQPGFQNYMDTFAAPTGQGGMAGILNSQPGTSSMAPQAAGYGVGMNNMLPPFLQQPFYDFLTPLGKLKDYKEGGSSVKFHTFDGTDDKLKALLFIQQFDAAYAGGHFTESSKVRKAATFLKENALQWWTTLLMQGYVPSSWVHFKQLFASEFITSTFEVDVLTAWNKLNAENCSNLKEYNKQFWSALLPVISFRLVPLTEQIEKYCCGLPKSTRDYVTKTKCRNVTQLIENAQVAYNLTKGEGFKGPWIPETLEKKPEKAKKVAVPQETTKKFFLCQERI